MKVRSAIFTVPGTTGNHSFNITGWGETPVAVKVEVIGTGATDGYTNTSIFGIGFSDGTRSYCIGHHVANGLTTTEAERATSANVIAIPNITGGTLEYSATFSQWNTGGVELTFSGTPNTAHRIQITYFAGADVSARADYALQAAHVETVGFTSKLIFTSTAGAGAFVADDFGLLSIGVTTNGVNGVTNSFCGIDYRSGQTTSMATAYISNTLCTGQVFNEGVTWSGSITSIDALGFNLSSDAGSDYVIFLALTFDGDVDSGVALIPTTGNISVTDPGFTPQSVGVIPTNLTALSTVVTAGDTVIGLGMADASYEGSLTVSGEDGVTTTNHTSVHASSLLHGEDADQVEIYDASFGSFTASGFDLTVNTSPATATYFVWWAIEAEAPSDVDIAGDIVGSSTVSADLSQDVSIEGGADGSSEVSADLTYYWDISGSIVGTSSVEATLTEYVNLTGDFEGTSTLQGDLTVIIPGPAWLSGNSVGSTILEADLTKYVALSGGMEGTSDLYADIDNIMSLAGNINGSSEMEADLIMDLFLEGGAVGSSVLAAILTTLSEYELIIGDSYMTAVLLLQSHASPVLGLDSHMTDTLTLKSYMKDE